MHVQMRRLHVCHKNIHDGLSLNYRETMALYICMEFYSDFEQ